MIRCMRTLIGIGTAAFFLVGNCGNGSEVLQPEESNKNAAGYSVNGITAQKGVPRRGVMISAYDTGYIPLWTFNGYSVHTVSDSTGKFHLWLTMGIRYNLLCIDTVSGSGAFIRLQSNDTDASLGTLSLDSLGSIAGKLYGDSVSGRPYNVYLKGTPFHSAADKSGAFSLFGIPTGTYIVIASEVTIAKNNPPFPLPPVSGFKGISVESGKTTIDSVKIK